MINNNNRMPLIFVIICDHVVVSYIIYKYVICKNNALNNVLRYLDQIMFHNYPFGYSR